jgi:UDP-N-acetylmuramyl tripeptide synthase
LAIAGPAADDERVSALPAALPPRTRAAATLGRWVAGLSKAVGAGSGSVVGGRVTLLADPGALRLLTAGRAVTLVTGTNGKTTTTRLLVEALRTRGPVTSNDTGSNMPPGMTAAAASAPADSAYVFEVDESYLPAAIEATAPMLVVLLNLSRDQLDRVAEVKLVAARWRRALTTLPAGATVVANADDPLVVWAASAATRPVWVAAGQRWRHDAAVCQSCGALLSHDEHGGWHCGGCDAARPAPQWAVDGSDVVAPDGERHALGLALPGRANRGNAALALAAAVTAGIELGTALAAMKRVSSVAGRYRSVQVGSHELRLLLAQNPAGWRETLEMIDGSSSPVVIVINARIADGRDPSWLWDVPFEQLRGRQVVAAGDRRLDLAVRLEVAGVAFTVADRVLAGVASLPPGPVDVVANYTSFQDLRRELPNAG